MEPPKSPLMNKDGAVLDPPEQQPPSLYDGPRASEESMEKIKGLEKDVDEVTGIMNKNVINMLQRGENLEDLSKKAETIQDSSKEFARTAGTVKKKLWWNNVKMGIIVAGVLLVLIIGGVAYGIISSNKEND